ncbi:MAG: response regulator [Blastochloris sp.]|nr:response regulator [Blastochloris sp.]
MTDAQRIAQLEEQLRLLQIQLEQARTVPSGIESQTLHDLNGALAVAQGQAHMALLDLPSHAKARPSVEEFCQATRKALDLLATLYQNNKSLQLQEKTEPSPPPSTSPEDWHGSGTVFLIDDEEDMREMLRRVLTHYGYQVLLASNGEEALTLFREKHQTIHLVFMDMTMPRLNGLEAFKVMRQIDPGMPIVMTSGYSEVNLAEQWPELGMNAFLRKPCELKTLLSTVRHNIRSA